MSSVGRLLGQQALKEVSSDQALYEKTKIPRLFPTRNALLEHTRVSYSRSTLWYVMIKRIAPVSTCLMDTSHQIDLKHYKTRQIALRWRTAEEVLASIGETTCACLRCPYHNPSPEQLSQMDERGIDMPRLQAFELPFAYIEAGEKKQALVKVKVCDKCARKVTYKPSGAEGSTKSPQQDANDSIRRSHRDSIENSRTASPEGSRREGGRRQRRRSDSPQRT